MDNGLEKKPEPVDRPPVTEEERKRIEYIVKQYGSIQEWRKERRVEMKDDFDYDFKIMTYLLGAHAAGIAGGLTFLKDKDNEVNAHGVGLIVSLFCGGFVISCIAFVMFEVLRDSIFTSFRLGEPFPSYSVIYSFRIPQTLSLIVLLVAVGLIAFKTWQM